MLTAGKKRKGAKGSIGENRRLVLPVGKLDAYDASRMEQKDAKGAKELRTLRVLRVLLFVG
jgi:hypothetical protein